MVDINNATFIDYTTPQEVAMEIAAIDGDVVVRCQGENPSSDAAAVQKELNKLVTELERKAVEPHAITAKKELYHMYGEVARRVCGVYRLGAVDESPKVNVAFIGRDTSKLWPTSVPDNTKTSGHS